MVPWQAALSRTDTPANAVNGSAGTFRTLL